MNTENKTKNRDKNTLIGFIHYRIGKELQFASSEIRKLAYKIVSLNYNDDKILIEVGLDVREIECAALGGYEPLMSSAGEVIPQAEFYTYDAKYIDAHGALVEVPAKLTQEEVAEVREIAKKCFMALNLYGLGRIDLFLEKNTRKFYFNEANTIPGFTPISQYPMLWQYDGYSPQKLLTSLVDSALERHERRKLLKTFI